MSAELLSCPFCGGSASVRYPFTSLDGKGSFPRCYVVCTQCRTQTGSSHDEAETIATWNYRVGAAPGADARPVANKPTGDQVRAIIKSVGSLGTNHGDAPTEYVLAGWRAALATRDAAPIEQAARATAPLDPAELTSDQIRTGWENTFSTNNPFCPCDLKSFTKAARWAERTLTASAPREKS